MPSPSQHASATHQFTSGTTGTITPAFGSALTAGSCIAACVTISVSEDISTVSVTSITTNGSAENWAQAAEDAQEIVFIWACPDTGGGQTAIDIAVAFGQTATTSESVAVMADIFEIPGVAPSGPVDKTSTDFLAPATSTSWTSGTTATTTAASEIWIGCGWIGMVSPPDTAETITPPGSPWTTTTVLSTSIQAGGTGTSSEFFTYQSSGYQVVSSTGAATYAGTCSVSSIWSAAVVTLAAGSPVAVRPRPVLLNQAVQTAATW